ncbi:MAG: hypothetical protein J0M15_04950 [Deltaproteobacteria bacterium]|jgi:hypothetical protein|nr:hypothetical protein [Deltaproteobacteria bacterium]
MGDGSSHSIIDMIQSMGLNRKLSDHEIEIITAEVQNLIKNEESMEYLLSLIQKKEILEEKDFTYLKEIS